MQSNGFTRVSLLLKRLWLSDHSGHSDIYELRLNSNDFLCEELILPQVLHIIFSEGV